MARFTALDGSHKRLPIIGVDLGYSAEGRTSGIAASVRGYASRSVTFGDAIQETAQLLSEFDGEAIVCVEAVLSIRHDARGNPCLRSESERGRAWYCQPGVVTFAAALRFIEQLARRAPKRHRIYLAEAFLTNKPTKTKHEDDATRIVKEFWKAGVVTLHPDVVPLSNHILGVPSVRNYRSS